MASAAAGSQASLEDENAALQARLKALQTRLKEEEQYSYIVAKGMIADAENVFMETMDLVSAKQWCNSNERCKGFTFLGGEDGAEQQDEEVTVTFKGETEAGGALQVAPDTAYMSYIKHSAAHSVLGAVGDAGMQLEGTSAYLVGQWIGFESAVFAFALAIALAFGRHRLRRREPAAVALLPR
jgi:hypothetical protein